MKKLIVFSLFVFSILLSSCGGNSAYDPLLKYENAGYSVVRVGNYGSVNFTDSILCSSVSFARCTNYDYYVALVTNSNVIEQLKIMDSTSSNVRFVYTNRMIVSSVIPLSNRVLVMDSSGTLFQFGTDFQNMIKTNLVSDYSNSFKEIVGDQSFSIPQKDVEEITPVYGAVLSVSPKGKYLLVRIPIVWKDVVLSMDDRKMDAMDYGTAIIDIDTFSVIRLYDISQIDGTGADSSNYERNSFLDITFKYVYIESYNLGFYGKSIGGRTSEDLRGIWRIDISSLGLSE